MKARSHLLPWLLVFSLALPALGPTPTLAEESFTFSLQSPSLIAESVSPGSIPFSMPGYTPIAQPGDPLLPARIVSVAVPPDIDWSTLEVEAIQVKSTNLTGTYSFPPAGPLITWDNEQEINDWGSNSANIKDGKNRLVYETDAFFPASPVELVTMSQMRKWRFFRMTFTPMQFNPVQGQVRYNEEVVVRVSYHRRVSGPNVAELADTMMDDQASVLFENYTQAQSWYPLPSDPGILREQDEGPGYAVITTNAIVAGSSLLDDFLLHQQALGMSTFLVTEADYGGLVGQPPNTTAEKIRQWLLMNYLDLNLRYVLLIGNPDPYDPSDPGGPFGDVPMQMTWPRMSYYNDAPSDYYYADLTGNWDLDGDQYFGENPDDAGPGGVDFAPEVYVGRIPVYTYIGGWQAELDSILQKTMAYYGTEGTWRDKVLLANSFLSDTFDSANITERMHMDYLAPLGFPTYRMYQDLDGPNCNTDFYPDEHLLNSAVRNHWSGAPYGIVAWNGHGSSGGTYLSCGQGTLFSNDQVASLSNETPAFTFQGSCYNGFPEAYDNLGARLLVNGAIGTISASRVSWYTGWDTPNPYYGDNANLEYHYIYHLIGNEPAGQALYDMKDMMSVSGWWMNMMVYNLYGDPSITLYSPAILTVTNTADSGPGSLRWAVDHIADNGEVRFELTLPVTISLTSGELVIDNIMALYGPGSDLLTISGSDVTRVFNISGPHVWIQGLQIQNGRAQYGGGIYNTGNLELVSVKLNNNQARPSEPMTPEALGGAIYNSGTLAIYGGQLTGNDVSSSDVAYGGGIANFGSLLLHSVTLNSNTTGGWHNYGGAGIYNEGSLTLYHGTLEGNSANGHYGGKGGGLLNTGVASINNCTITGNEVNVGSQGGGIHNTGDLYVNNCTIAYNSGYDTGGISGSAYLLNTIIAHHEASNGGNCGSSTITSGGHNLDSDGTCDLTGPGDLTNVDPILGPLEGYEDSPYFLPLLTGSPAIDAGETASCVGKDQRGIDRPQGTDCDIGAYEAIQLYISDGQVLEGDEGITEMQFWLEASTLDWRGISVQFNTEDGSAQGLVDFTPISATLMLPLYGDPTIAVTIPIIGDLIDEPDETFTVTLRNPYNAVLMNDTAQELILDDDTAFLVLANTTVLEGATDTPAFITVTLDLSHSLPVQVDWTTIDGTALAGQDYTAASGTLTFPPNSLHQTIEVEVLGDGMVEPDEEFTIQLTNPVNAGLSNEYAQVTITDMNLPTISCAEVQNEEGNGEMVFLVRLSQPSYLTVTLDYATANDSALAGSDYQATSGTLSFSPGTTEMSITVYLIDDELQEPDERFWLAFSNPINAGLMHNTTAGILLNDDFPDDFLLFVPLIIW